MECEFDHIVVNPTIQHRVDRMRRRQAEERANRDAAIAIEAVQDRHKYRAENMRLKAANTTLLQQVHAALGWPRRLMLPAPEVMA